MAANYEQCRYSVTVRTHDLGVLHMLRGLSQHCESGAYKQIAWGGTKEKDWERSGGQATFRFSAPADRERFLREAGRLLAPGLWEAVSSSDSNPATPRRG